MIGNCLHLYLQYEGKPEGALKMNYGWGHGSGGKMPDVILDQWELAAQGLADVSALIPRLKRHKDFRVCIYWA